MIFFPRHLEFKDLYEEKKIVRMFILSLVLILGGNGAHGRGRLVVPAAFVIVLHEQHMLIHFNGALDWTFFFKFPPTSC